MAYGFTTNNWFTVNRNYNIAEFSVSLWAYIPNGSVVRTFAGLWQDSGSLLQWQVAINGSNQPVFFVYGPGFSGGTATSISTGNWYNLVMVKTGASLYGYVNNTKNTFTGQNSAMTSRAISFGIGARPDGTNTASSDIAEFATWTRALTDAEVASLAKGFKPIRVPKPEIYIPLIRNKVDLSSAYAVTDNGSPTVANHPRVY